MKKIYKVVLSEAERSQLKSLSKKGKISVRKLKRIQILLLADESVLGSHKTDKEISESLLCQITTVERIRKRCVMEGLEISLSDKKRERVHERKLDGAGEAKLIQLACSDAPEGRNRWTLDLLTEQLIALKVVDTISRSTVDNTLKKTNLNLG